ncbi:ankyrin repeat domain-containing protein [Nocardiopsis sp. NPDC050513]|uniref:ankyrin repeat domain-containing protein n=1 Tax=Nocardiopsis sp. NPDC050513 TaxID=3364338 RepID=UPI003793FF53
MTALPPRPPSASHPPARAAWLRKVRLYAVPRTMVERAAERRLAGDWRGACAAAGVDTAFDMAAVANEHGTAFATALEEDLLHLVPDLVRWHMPRLAPHSALLTPDQTVALSRPGGGDAALPHLKVRTTATTAFAPQRLTLGLGPVSFGNDELMRVVEAEHLRFWSGLVHNWTTSRYLWDARNTGELRERCGGSTERAPFHHPDGRPLSAAELPSADPGPGDPAALTEWVDGLLRAGEVEAAFTATGIGLDTEPVELDWIDPVDAGAVAADLPLDPCRLGSEVRRLREAGHGDRYWIPHTLHDRIVIEVDDDGLRLGVDEYETWAAQEAHLLPEACWRRSPDIDVLRDGGAAPDHLHPLVRAALFPARPPADGPVGPPDPAPPAPLRVRCQGVWHRVAHRGGALEIPHDEEERRREAALRAFGGASSGCFAAREAWTSVGGRLPRALRAQRDDLFERARHGDTDGVLRLLDAGMDPRARDRRGRTLLHHLAFLDHETVLPRLLKEGLEVDTEDDQDRTPLYAAVTGGGPVDLARALVGAGARTEDTGLDTWEEQTSLVELVNERCAREVPPALDAWSAFKEEL